MKKLIGTALLAMSFPVLADTYVQGHYRSNGTYVQPHYRTDSNSVRYDNYSSQGNTNPYTGSQGNQRNEFSDPPAYNSGRRNSPCFGLGCRKDD